MTGFACERSTSLSDVLPSPCIYDSLTLFARRLINTVPCHERRMHVAKEVPFGTLLNPERVYQQGGQNLVMVTSTKKVPFASKKGVLGSFFAPRILYRKASKEVHR